MTETRLVANTAAVTDLLNHGGQSPAVEAAVAAAVAAARSTATHVRQLDGLTELKAVPQLYQRIWRPGGTTGPVTTELLLAMAKAGSYVGGAFDGDELVGACIGFFAPPASEALHSHIAGVSARMRGRSVGFALKLHQRAWALLRGVGEVCWTFDPLVRRNASFNIGKLAAEPTEYLANFYGQMDDGINGSDESDRLLVSWRLNAPDVVAACSSQRRIANAAAERAAGAVLALDISSSGRPVAGRTDADTVLVAVPADIEQLRVADGSCAAAWRSSVREVLGGLLADGARVRGFDRAGWYIVDRRNAR